MRRWILINIFRMKVVTMSTLSSSFEAFTFKKLS